MRRAATFLLFTLGLVARPQGTAQTPAERFHLAENRWSAHRPGGSVLDDGSPAAREALAAMWSAVADLALAVLRSKPDTTAEALAHSLTALEPKPDPRFGPQISASAVKLDHGIFAVAFNDDAAGTIFILGPQRVETPTDAPTQAESGARTGTSKNPESAAVVQASAAQSLASQPLVLWSLSAPADQPGDAAGLLRAWQVARQGEACREPHHGGNHDGTCGPLTATLTALHEDSAGHARFLLDATYSQDMGATFGKQTSIWAWDGAQPHLLWINLYAINAEQPFDMRYTDGLLEIGEKAQFQSFFACGSCDGRQLIHAVRLTGTGVQDLGTRSSVPELDALDTLFSTLAGPGAVAGAPAEALASPAVLATLRPLLAKALLTKSILTRSKADSAKVSPEFFSLGMLQDSTVHRRGGVSDVCLIIDRLGCLNATLEGRADQLYVSSLTHDASVKPGSCN